MLELPLTNTCVLRLTRLSLSLSLKAGEFGIRLETVLRVVEKKGLKYEDKDDYGPFLGFEPVRQY